MTAIARCELIENPAVGMPDTLVTAAWAEFFNMLRIECECQPPPIRLSKGRHVRVDFCLPSLGVYVTARGNGALPAADFRDALDLAADGDSVLLIIGQPGAERMHLLDEDMAQLWEYLLLDCRGDEPVAMKLFLEGLKEWSCVQLAAHPLAREWRVVYRVLPPSIEFRLSQALKRAALTATSATGTLS